MSSIPLNNSNLIPVLIGKSVVQQRVRLVGLHLFGEVGEVG